MKKLFSLVTVLLCVVMLSTTAFAASIDPLAIYTKYLKNQVDITSLDMSMTQKISMVDGTDSLDILKQDIALKMLMPSEDKLEMEMRISDPDSGEISYAYFKNDYLYQQVGDDKYKIKMDMNQALANAGNIDVEFSEDMLKDAKIEMLDEGIKITYKTDLNSIKGEDGTSIASLLEQMELPDEMKVSISKMTTTAIIGYDGVLKSGTNVIGMKISDGETNLEFKVVQSFRVNSINSIQAIKYPDLSGYQLLTA